jgi:uncharacterized protein YfaS (alpha-2-macroglobulin family)
MATQKEEQGPFAPQWQKVKQLEEEQKYDAALGEVKLIIEAAQKANNQPEWSKALVRATLLQRGVHSNETAVRFFLESKWPEDATYDSLLRLFYAATLNDYYNHYAWEINQREKVAASKGLDLKQWTAFDIFAEVHKQYLTLYQRRELLAKLQAKDYPDYLTPGNAPGDIRASLRDFVVYAWGEFLGNTTTWRPYELKEKHKLDFSDLANCQKAYPADFSAEKSASGDAHPLTKLCALLEEHFCWHNAAGRHEAALEARLEKIRHLGKIFGEASRCDTLIASLNSLLPGYVQYPWWAMGQYEAAALYEKKGDLVAAHDTAVAAHTKYPESMGGQRCLYLAKNIEAPDFNITTMSVDRPRTNALEIVHKNVTKLYLRAYFVNFFEWLNRPYRYLSGMEYNELRDIVHKARPLVSWEVELKDVGDYRLHKTYATPPLDKFGFYVIAAGCKPEFELVKRDDGVYDVPKGNRIMATSMLLSPFVVVTNPRDNGWEVFVNDGTSGKPVADALVALYKYQYDSAPSKTAELKTDARGYAYFPAHNDDYLSYYVIVAKDNDFAFDPNSVYFGRSSTNREPQRGCFIYTDRSIYRPLQKLYFKVVTYSGRAESGNYHCVSNAPISTTLLDANGKEVAKVEGTTNDYGTASGEFMIPTGRVLGSYSLRSYAGKQGISIYGQTYFRVEEYKRPTFEVTMQQPEKPLRLNEKAAVKGEVRYYFGLPVTSGKVFYRVTRVPVWPWWYWWFYRGSGDARHTYEVGAGTAQLDTDGKFSVEFMPEADPSLESDPELSYNFQVEADVTDEGGETRNAKMTYPIGFVSVRASLDQPHQFFTAQEKVVTNIVRSDLSGTPQPGEASYRLVRLQQPDKVMLPQELPVAIAKDSKVTTGDKLRPRWESDKTLEEYLFFMRDGELVQEGKLSHGEDGKATLEIASLPAGVYRLYYNTSDIFGQSYQTRKDFLVAGPQFHLAMPFFLIAQEDHRKVGEDAVFLLGSGAREQPYWLEIYQAGRLIKRELREAKDGDIFELKIDENKRGGFSVRVWGVYDYGFYSQSQNIQVPWDNKQLQVSFKSFRNLLRPGEKETWTVSVRGPRAEVVAAEILAYMYDRSLDFFTPHHYPTLDSLLPRRYGLPYSRSNLSSHGLSLLFNNDWYVLPAYVHYQTGRLHMLDGYPIGGLGRRMYYAESAPGALDEDGAVATRKPMMMQARAKNGGEKANGDDEKPKPSAPPAVSATTTTPEQPKEAQEPKAKAEEAPLRSNFQETAFFKPHLTVDKNGEANIEFSVPDSVTSWMVYLHAITKDLCFMVTSREVKTRKDLMVRPYMPRFLREGDDAVLKVVINNAGDKNLSGEVTLAILNDKQEDVSDKFGVTGKLLTWQAEAKKSANVSWQLKTPAMLGIYSFEVRAHSENLGDGELRPIPVLPSRMHLTQSKFVTVKEGTPRTLTIPDLARAGEDPTLLHEKLVMTVDAQLIYTVLKALPYLTDYPYECVEQTLNRFLATGIVTSLYDQYPPIARMARQFSQRKTQLEAWGKDDPNRKMALEETPWLYVAEGGSDDMSRLINVLDAKIAKVQRDMSLDKLAKAQLGNGAFPWFPGGPPSPYMTLYLVYGFAKATEFKVEVPKDMVRRAWMYLGQEFRDYYAQKMLIEEYGYEFITFLHYVLSCYQDSDYYRGAFSEDERQKMLDFSWKHWKKHCPYLKAYLALTLVRMKRAEDAKLIMESIMDSAKTAEDQGTFWAPEDRGWLWYNDNIESHAFILRALQEVEPDNTKHIEGLTLWLFLNKKMNQWKSTRTTAEVIYALVYTMQRQKALAVREAASITLGNQKHQFVFEPDQYTGERNQIVIPGAKIIPATMSQAVAEKTGPGFMFASMTWHYSTEKMPQEARGDFLYVIRAYYLRQHQGKEYVLKPLADGEKLKVGDQVEVQISIRSKHPMEYVHLRDPRGAGFEPESQVSGHRWNLGIYWYEEVRDSGMNFFFEWLPQGEYPFKYRLRVNMAGKFRIGPATIQSMYAPEFAGFSEGHVLEVEK